jgi:alkylhydroperoxidase family enzyme
MEKQIRGVAADVSAMPRLGRSPAPEDPARDAALGIGRHASMEDMARRTLMWNPELHAGQAALAEALRKSARLTGRVREIAILRLAWIAGCDYQWGMHVEMALDAGLTPDEVERVPSGADHAGWAPHEISIINAVDELHASALIGDTTWAELATHYDEAQMIELMVLIGSYRLLAGVLNSVGIRPPAGTSPDRPGNTFSFST